MSGECPVCDVKVNLMTDEYKFCFEDNQIYHQECYDRKEDPSSGVGEGNKAKMGE